MTSPCPIELDPDRGKNGEKGWYCGHCEKNVHVLSNLTEREARALLADKVGEDLCVTYAVRSDGTIRFRPEPEPALVPVRALRRRRVAAVAAAGLSVALAACTPHDNPEVDPPRIEVEESSTPTSTPTIPDARTSRRPEPDERIVDGGLKPDPLPLPAGGIQVERLPPPEPEIMVDGGLRAEPPPSPPPKPGGLKVAPLPMKEPKMAVPGGLMVEPLPADAPDQPCDQGDQGERGGA